MFQSNFQVSLGFKVCINSSLIPSSYSISVRATLGCNMSRSKVLEIQAFFKIFHVLPCWILCFSLSHWVKNISMGWPFWVVISPASRHLITFAFRQQLKLRCVQLLLYAGILRYDEKGKRGVCKFNSCKFIGWMPPNVCWLYFKSNFVIIKEFCPVFSQVRCLIL